MRIALITGGAGGLGLATAKRMANDGLVVAIADLDGGAAEAAAASLHGKGHIGLALNVTDERSVIDVFDVVERRLGPVAVLATFAGTIGLFVMLLFLFVRVMPAISIAEMRELVAETSEGHE